MNVGNNLRCVDATRIHNKKKKYHSTKNDEKQIIQGSSSECDIFWTTDEQEKKIHFLLI